MAKFCTNCGKELGENDNACANCGTFVNDNKQVVSEMIQKPSGMTNGFSIAGFVLSIISILSCGTTSVLGLVFSIIGLVNVKKYNNNGKGLAIAGIVISSIGLLMLIVLTLIGIFGELSYSDYHYYY